jgi:hypothetical protein
MERPTFVAGACVRRRSRVADCGGRVKAARGRRTSGRGWRRDHERRRVDDLIPPLFAASRFDLDTKRITGPPAEFALLAICIGVVCTSSPFILPPRACLAGR